MATNLVSKEERQTENMDGGGGWWSSWVDFAKEKSTQALEATKRDLAEFVSVVSRDTTQAVSNTAQSMKGIVLPESTNKHTIKEAVKTPESPTIIYDRSQTQLQALRANPQTYCSIPEGHAAEFLQWSNSFDLSLHQEQISKLLVDSEDVRQLHSDLVPVQTSYEAFWHRYFYRLCLLEKEEEQRAEIMARAGSQGKLINWEEEEEEEACNPVAKRSDTDSSSDSFICVNEDSEGLAADSDTSSQHPPPFPPLPPAKVHTEEDWEEWSD